MRRRCIDLVRHEVLHRVLLISIIGHLLRDEDLLLAELRDVQLLRPDLVGLAVYLPLGRVDALGKRIDADHLAAVLDVTIALEDGNPVLVVRFDVFDEFLRAVPAIEEVGARRDTYLVSFVDECFGVVDLRVGFLLVETEAERVCGFIAGVLAEDEVLTPDGVVFRVVVEPANIRELIARFVGDGVVPGGGRR